MIEDNTIEYAKYLRSELFKYNGDLGLMLYLVEHSMYRRLTQLIEDGRIKDVLSKQSSLSSKVEVLNSMLESITNYLANRGDVMSLMTYDEFVSIKRDDKLNIILSK